MTGIEEDFWLTIATILLAVCALAYFEKEQRDKPISTESVKEHHTRP